MTAFSNCKDINTKTLLKAVLHLPATTSIVNKLNIHVKNDKVTGYVGHGHKMMPQCISPS